MNNNEELIDVVNELVRINYDRVFGYETAIEDVENVDVDLKAIFTKYAEQSRNNVNELQQTVRSLGGEAVTDSTVRGKLYRVWMDFKATLTGKDRQSILNSCEYGEDAAQRAYKEALQTQAHLPDNVRLQIIDQQRTLKAAHDSIRDMRDVMEKVS